MEREKTKTELENNKTLDDEQRKVVDDAIETAKTARRRIKHHIEYTKAKENALGFEYDTLLNTIAKKEEEICGAVRKMCQAYRNIVENDKQKMHSVFQEELAGGQESKQFVSACYKLFKGILNSEHQASQLVLLELDATVAKIFACQVPHWTVPCLEVGEDTIKDLLKSLIGDLVISKTQTVSHEDFVPPEAPGTEPEIHESDDDNDDDENEAAQNLSTDLESTTLNNEEEWEEPVEETNRVSIVSLDHCFRPGFLHFLKRRKKRKKHVAIGRELLRSAEWFSRTALTQEWQTPYNWLWCNLQRLFNFLAHKKLLRGVSDTSRFQPFIFHI